MKPEERSIKEPTGKSHKAVPLPERSADEDDEKGEGSSQKTVGTKTPGLKGKKDMPVAMERKARQKGETPKLKK